MHSVQLKHSSPFGEGFTKLESPHVACVLSGPECYTKESHKTETLCCLNIPSFGFIPSWVASSNSSCAYMAAEGAVGGCRTSKSMQHNQAIVMSQNAQ